MKIAKKKMRVVRKRFKTVNKRIKAFNKKRLFFLGLGIVLIAGLSVLVHKIYLSYKSMPLAKNLVLVETSDWRRVTTAQRKAAQESIAKAPKEKYLQEWSYKIEPWFDQVYKCPPRYGHQISAKRLEEKAQRHLEVDAGGNRGGQHEQ